MSSDKTWTLRSIKRDEPLWNESVWMWRMYHHSVTTLIHNSAFVCLCSRLPCATIGRRMEGGKARRRVEPSSTWTRSNGGHLSRVDFKPLLKLFEDPGAYASSPGRQSRSGLEFSSASRRRASYFGIRAAGCTAVKRARAAQPGCIMRH